MSQAMTATLEAVGETEAARPAPRERGADTRRQARLEKLLRDTARSLRASLGLAAVALALWAPVWQRKVPERSTNLTSPDPYSAHGSGGVPVSFLTLVGEGALGPAGTARTALFLALEAALIGALVFVRRFGAPRPAAQDEVLQTVSHDLRAPLAATEGYIKYLMGCEPGTLNGEQVELLNTALANLNRLEHFVADTLDLARLDAGRMTYRVEPGELRPAVEEVVRLFRFTAQDRAVWLFDLVPPDFPRARMDAEKVERVLTNLVSNALKFTAQEGRVAVTAAVERGEAVVTVSDTGIGIPEAKRRRLFERFTAPGAPKGTGLGLWIAKGLVEGQGGRIWADSKPGVGTRVRFTLPLEER